MDNETVFSDLSKFGYRELAIAGELLTAYAQERNFASAEDESTLSDGVAVWMNANSGNVFLCDEDYNTLMLNDSGKLEAWMSCGECGYEAFRSQYRDLEGEHKQAQHELIEQDLCPFYKAQILPDENGNCSLCGKHKV